MYIHGVYGYSGESYLDDLIGVASQSVGEQAYASLGELLAELGLMENFDKACPPATVQVVLGILIDTVNGTCAVPEERMQQIIELLSEWSEKKTSTKVELQALIGLLQYVTKCVLQSRVFLSRMLETLRFFKPKLRYVTLSSEFQKDICWWSRFIERYNGVSYIPSFQWSEPDVSFSTDSCLYGCGGICGKEYFHAVFPKCVRGLPIHCLEMLAVLVGVRIWGSQFEGQKIQIFCDNIAVVQVINSSRTRDAFLASCLRELWLEVSTHEFELRAVHLPGEENRVADRLSRWELGTRYKEMFNEFIADDSDEYFDIFVPSKMFEFTGDL